MTEQIEYLKNILTEGVYQNTFNTSLLEDINEPCAVVNLNGNNRTIFFGKNKVVWLNEQVCSSTNETTSIEKIVNHNYIPFTIEELEELKDDEIIGDLIKEIIEKLKELN